MKKMILIATIILAKTLSFANENNLNNTIPSASTVQAEPQEEEYYYERRFSAITEMGATMAYQKPYFTLYQAVGIKVNPYVFIGQGVGLQVSNNKLLQIQALFDIRTFVLDKKVTPMFVLQAGINKVSNAPINMEKQLKDLQFNMNLGTGILIKAKENASFTLNGGYTIFSDFKNNMHGGFVKVGYVF